MTQEGAGIDESQVDVMLGQITESERDRKHGAPATPSHFKWQEADSHLDPEDRTWVYVWNLFDKQGRLVWLAAGILAILIAAELLSLFNR